MNNKQMSFLNKFCNIDNFLLFALFFAAFLIRVPGLFTDRLWPDEALYAYQARETLRHPAFLLSAEAWRHHFPLFSAFLSLGWLLHPSVVGLRLLMTVLNIMAIPLLYVLGRKMFSRETGILAAALLVSSRLFFTFAHFILIDMALAMAVLLVFYYLWQIKPDQPASRWPVGLGCSILLAVILKWYVVLIVVPQVMLFYLLFLKGSLQDRLKGLVKALLPVVIIGIPFTAIKILQVIREGGPAIFHPLPWYTYFKFSPIFLGGIPLAILFFVGLFYVVKEEARVKGLLLLWIVLPLFVFSCVPEKDLRYLLIMLPACSLISAFAIVRLRDSFIHAALAQRCVFLTAFILIFLFGVLPTEKAYDNFLYRHYTGFQEAGTWIKEHARKGDIILAGSIRAIHFTADVPLQEYGGPLRPLPPDFEQLRILARQNQRILMEIDLWEYIQPKWAYILTQEKEAAIESLGFTLRKLVFPKSVSGGEPVVGIFVKD